MTRPRMVVVDSSTSKTETLMHGRIATTCYFSWHLWRLRLDFGPGRLYGSLADLRNYYFEARNAQTRQLRLYRVHGVVVSLDSAESEKDQLWIMSDLDYYKKEIASVGFPEFWDWNWARLDIQKYPRETRLPVIASLLNPKRRLTAEAKYFLNILNKEPFNE